MTSVMNGMCRCCATEGVYKDIKTSYTWMGEEEVYADMLRECFDLCLSTSEGVEDGGICEVCITQLRNAANFKKQVQNTEEQFKKLALNKLFKPNIVKVEADEEDAGNDSDDNNASADESYSGPEYEVPIKTETEDPKPRKRAVTPRAAKASTSRAKKSKADNGEPSTKRSGEESLMIEIEVDTSYMIDDDGDYKLDEEESQVAKQEVDKHRENIRTILLSTNATPIGRYISLGYSCCFCTAQYLDPNELKTHTLTCHNEENFATFMNNHTILNYIVKLDITGLRCELCNSYINGLQELMDHLVVVHQKYFHTDIHNRILPFKFDTDTLHCPDCSFEYNNFKILLEHMNAHYGHQVCELCDARFVNRRMLQAHMYRHKVGEFKCDHCDKVFDTRIKMKVHERMVHMKLNKRPKCNVCRKKFKDFEKMIKHQAETHGMNLKFKCEMCDKMFLTLRTLKTHSQYYCPAVLV